MAAIKKYINNKHWRGCALAPLVGMHTTVEDGMETPYKLGVKPPYEPAVPLLGIYPEEAKTEKDTWENSAVHCSTIHSSWNTEATEMPIDRGMDREVVVHIYDGILLSHRKGCV